MTASGRRETYGTILLSLAAVLTAWCAFQAAVWDGRQQESLALAAAAGREASYFSVQANQLRQVDVATFVAFVNAQLSGNAPLAEFYRKRFRPEFQVAFEAWSARDPFHDGAAPLHPFRMAEYKLASDSVSAVRAARSDSTFAGAQAANARSDRYFLGTVLLSTVLFFAAIASRMASPRSQIALLVLGTALLGVALGHLATLPVALDF